MFLRASVDSKAAPINFPLSLVKLKSQCASHTADKIVNCLLKNGNAIELLQKALIEFFGNGVSVMLMDKVKSRKVAQRQIS